MLVVFCENLSKSDLSLVVDRSKLIFFVERILKSKIVFILRGREQV